jgi:hypothetical protein
MKKLSFLIASIVVLLTVGIFTSQAVSYDADNFTNLNFDFGRYVEDDVYKYKCNKTNYTCSKVKVSSLSSSTSSDLYDTESECKSKCKAIAVDKSYTEYTGGISTDWWTSDDDEDDYTKEDSWSYTEKTNDGLSGWDFTFGGDDKEDKGNKTNLNEFSDPSNSLGFDLFSWGNDVKKEGIISLNTDVVTDPFASSLDSTKGDSIYPTENKQTTNIFDTLLKSLGIGEESFYPMGDQAGEELSFDLEVSPTEITNKKEAKVKIKWDAEDKFEKCEITYSVTDDWSRKTGIKTKGEKTINIEYDSLRLRETDNKKTITIRIKCTSKEGKSVTETEKVIFHKLNEGGGEEDEDTSIEFTATSPKKTEGKQEWKSNLEWKATGYSECKFEEVKNVLDLTTESLTSGKKEVTFSSEGDYTLKIVCTKEDKTDSKQLTISIKEEEKLSYDAKDKISNNCTLKFTDSKGLFNETKGEDEDGNETIMFSANVTFSCTGDRIKDDPKKIIPGYDVRDIKYGVYLESYDDRGKKSLIECSTKDGSKIFSEPEPFENQTLRCAPSGNTLAIILEWAKQKRSIKPVAYVEFKTYEMTGFYHGEEHVERLTLSGKTIEGKWSGKGNEEKECNLNIQLFDPKDENYLEFRDYNGGTISIKVKSEYENHNLNVNTEPITINRSNDNYTASYPAGINTTDKDIIYDINLKCYNSDTDFKTQSIKVVVPKNDSKGLKKICLANKCDFEAGLGGQITLYQKDGKITHSSDLEFSFKVTNGCNLNTFQKTFGRVSVDNKAINPDFTVWKGETERKAVFENVWSLLPEKTKENIEKTFEEYINVDGVPVTFFTEVWSTFDEDLARLDEDGKKLNCNWTDKLPKKVIFVLDKTDDNTGTKPKEDNDGTKPKEDNTGTKPKDDNTGTKPKTDTIQEIFKLSASKTNLKVGENFDYYFEGELPNNAEDVECNLIFTETTGESYNHSKLKNFDFESFKTKLSLKGWSFIVSGKWWEQVRCEDKNGNKYYSNTIEFNVIEENNDNTKKEPTLKISTEKDYYEVRELFKLNIDSKDIPDNAKCKWIFNKKVIQSGDFSKIRNYLFTKTEESYDEIQLSCYVEEMNDFFRSNVLTIQIKNKQETVPIVNTSKITFTCIGCEQCKYFSAIPTWRKDRSKEKEIIFSPNLKDYEVELPVGRVKDWTLRFLNCDPTPTIIKNDYNWKVFAGRNLQPPDIIGTFIRDISIGVKNLGTVEIEIKK